MPPLPRKCGAALAVHCAAAGFGSVPALVEVVAILGSGALALAIYYFVLSLKRPAA